MHTKKLKIFLLTAMAIILPYSGPAATAPAGEVFLQNKPGQAPVESHSQEKSAEKMPQMKNITLLRDGLSGSSVNDIKEAADGLVWLATSNGVNLYDGNRVKTFPMPKDDGGKPQFCYSISLTDNGDVLAASKNGLYILHRGDDAFERLSDLKRSECVLSLKGKVYAGNSQGLYEIGKDGKAIRIDAGDENISTNNSVRCLKSDTQGNLWFTKRNDIGCYDPKTKKIRMIPVKNYSGLVEFDIADGTIFLGTKNEGLFIVNPKTGGYNQKEGLGNVISSVETTADGKYVCIGTDGNGAFLLNAKTLEIEKHLAASQGGDIIIASNAVYSYIRSKNGIDFIGMFRHGLCHTALTLPLFEDYSCGNFTTKGMKVRSFCKSGKYMLVCTDGGFYCVNEETKTSTYHDTRPFGMNLMKGVASTGDIFYITSYDAGVIKYNAATKSLSRDAENDKLTYSSASGITTDKQGNVWMTGSEGIFIISPDGKTENLNENNSKLPRGLHNLVFDSNGNAWLGTSSGLRLILTKNREIKDKDYPDSLFVKGDYVLGLPSKDRIYAINANRVYYTDATMHDYGELKLPAGVLDEKCTDFAYDDLGHYWVVSEKGLFAMAKDLKSAMHLGSVMGIGDAEISSASMVIDESKTMWLGTAKGLKYTDLRKFDDLSKQYNYKVSFGEVIRAGEKMSNGQVLKVNDSKKINLSWNLIQEKLVLMPIIVDFVADDNCIYEYQKGSGGEWQMLSAHTPLEITGLWPGTHKLKVRMSGLPHTASEYTIIVLPGLLFWIEAALALIALVLFILWRRYKRKTKAIIAEHSEIEQALIEENEAQIQELSTALQEQQAALQEQQTEINVATVDAQNDGKAAVAPNGGATIVSPAAAAVSGGQGTAEIKDESSQQKYIKGHLSNKEMQRIAREMTEYVKDKKPYLDKELKMSDIASKIGVSPSALSQVFSLYLKQNYYDWINAFRLEEFKKRVAAGEHKKLTVTALSEQCGFKKTSFFTTFRKVEGMSPTEYINRH